MLLKGTSILAYIVESFIQPNLQECVGNEVPYKHTDFFSPQVLSRLLNLKISLLFSVQYLS